MKAEKQHQVGGNESEVQGLALALGGSEPGAAGEHHEKAIILAGVVPRAPADVESENPRNNGIPEMGDQASEDEEQSDVYGEDAVFGELVVGMVGAIDGGHEMGVVEKKSEGVESKGPTLCGGGRGVIAEEQKRSRPSATADDEVEPGPVNPRTARRGTVTGRQRDGRGIHCGGGSHHLSVTYSAAGHQKSTKSDAE